MIISVDLLDQPCYSTLTLTRESKKMKRFKVKLFMGEYWIFEGDYPAEGGFPTEAEAKRAARNFEEAWN